MLGVRWWYTVSEATRRQMQDVLGEYVLPEIEPETEKPLTNSERLAVLEKRVDQRLIELGVYPPDTTAEDN